MNATAGPIPEMSASDMLRKTSKQRQDGPSTLRRAEAAAGWPDSWRLITGQDNNGSAGSAPHLHK